jgi:hypothetical protein
VAQRLRAFLREIGPGGARAGAAILLLVVLLSLISLAVLWFALLSSRQEAAERDVEKEKAALPETEPEESPLIFAPGPSPERADAVPRGGRRQRGIPGLSGLDVASSLQYFPGTDFRCSRTGPDRDLKKHTCRSSTDDDPPVVYEVTVAEDDPLTVLWVEATARDATEEEAAEFLSYVARLSLPERDPVNAEAFVGRTISSGGQYFDEGAELRLYGTEEVRTLEIVATAPPEEQGPEITDLLEITDLRTEITEPTTN